MEKENKKTIFWDLDGTLAKWNPKASLEEVFAPGYFKDLEPETALVQLVNALAERDRANHYILSHYPPETTAFADKKLWCQRHLPAMDMRHFLFVPCGVDKAAFVRDLIKQELPKDYILVDDYSKNLINWENAGGTAIKWLNGINGTKGTFQGKKIRDPQNFCTVFPYFP